MWQNGAAGDSYLLQVMARGTCDSGIAAQMQEEFRLVDVL